MKSIIAKLRFLVYISRDMEMEAFENPWMKKIRLLTKMLLVSVAFNVGFGTTLLYTKMGSKSGGKKARALILEESNGEILSTYFKNTFAELVKELKNKQLLQDGYTKRDLALACLVNYHYLNLDKAISGKSLQRRKLTFIHADGGEGFQMEVFPNLDNLDFIMVEKFIKEEKWPFSAEGLFIDLKKGREASLELAFFATPEFTIVHTALKRLDENLSKERVLKLLLEGDWERVQNWVIQLKGGSDFLDGMRVFFQEYLREGSPEAAALWIALDSEFIQRKLTDLELHQLVQQVRENGLSTNIFLKQILCSVRSDEVRRESAYKLYEFAKMIPPDPYDHEEALKTFLPSMFVKKEGPKPVSVVYQSVIKKHTIVEGDSLWKISRKYKVSIEALRDENHLKTDNLKLGQELVIP